MAMKSFNTDGAFADNYKFLIGSKIIRQSYDIKDTERIIILSLPVNISGLIQLRGRVERHASHHGLTVDRRKVIFSYFISVVPDDVTDIDTVSPEEYKYIDGYCFGKSVGINMRFLSCNTSTLGLAFNPLA